MREPLSIDRAGIGKMAVQAVHGFSFHVFSKCRCTGCTAKWEPINMSNSVAHENILKQHGFSKRVRHIHSDRTVIDEITAPLHSGALTLLLLSPSEQTAGKLRSKLRDSDVALPTDKEQLVNLLEAIAETVPRRRKRFAGKTGWNGNWSSFVVQDRVIGGSASQQGLAPNSLPLVGRLARAGTAEGWRDQVAAPAQQSSMLVTCISAAFAAPLIPLRDEQSFGFCVFGDSRCGKTLGTVLAASFIGIGAATKLPTWRLSDAGFESLASSFQHMVVPIDDIENTGRDGSAKHRFLESIAYLFASGQAKVHQPRYDREHGRAEQPWRSILLTNGERSLVESSGSLQRQRGATLRFIDFPAVLAGHDIFDRLAGNPEGAARAAAKQQLMGSFRKACELNHGAAFDTYISYLIEHRQEVSGLVDQSIKGFEHSVRHPTDSDLTRDLARKFGLLFAAAELAISGRIVDWTSQVAMESIAMAYHAARKLLPDEAREMRQGLANLLRALRSLPRSVPIRSLSSAAGVEGYRWRSPSQFHCLIRVEKFQAIFDSVSQRKLIEKFLVDEGRIELAQPKVRSTRMRDLKVQNIWWNGERVRSLHINWPMKPTDKTGGLSQLG